MVIQILLRNTKLIKWAAYSVAVFFISILQSDPFLFPKIGHMGPLLLLPTIIFIAMFEGETAGAAFGVYAGLLWDAEESRLFGFDALFLMIFGIFVGLLVKYLFKNTVLIGAVFTTVLCFFLEFVTWFFFYNLYGDYDFLYAVLKIILPSCLYTLLLSIPIYYGIRFLSGKFTSEDADNT